jgi:hypothetical protein
MKTRFVYVLFFTVSISSFAQKDSSFKPISVANFPSCIGIGTQSISGLSVINNALQNNNFSKLPSVYVTYSFDIFHYVFHGFFISADADLAIPGRIADYGLQTRGGGTSLNAGVGFLIYNSNKILVLPTFGYGWRFLRATCLQSGTAWNGNLDEQLNTRTLDFELRIDLFPDGIREANFRGKEKKKQGQLKAWVDIVAGYAYAPKVSRWFNIDSHYTGPQTIPGHGTTYSVGNNATDFISGIGTSISMCYVKFLFNFGFF